MVYLNLHTINRINAYKQEFSKTHEDLSSWFDVLIENGYMIDDPKCKFDRFHHQYTSRMINNRYFVIDQFSIPLLNRVESLIKRAKALSEMMDNILQNDE